MSQFLQFFVREHNEHIIEVLIVLVLLSVLGYVVYSFYASTKDSDANSQIREIEGALKRVLQTTEVKASAVSGAVVTGAGGVSAGGDTDEAFLTMQKILEEREQELKAVRADFEKAKSGQSDQPASGGGDSTVLEGKIRDLESKLMEYSIIEDDIANLSLYKEENSKLKNEIEKLKKDVGAMSSAPAASTAAEPAPVAEVATEVAADDDLMAEFAAAVSAQKSTEAQVSKAVPAAPIPPAPTPVAAAVVEEPATDDDLMAEFAAAVTAQKAEEASPKKADEVVKEEVVKELEVRLDQVREDRIQFEIDLKKRVIENNLVGDGNFNEVVKDPDIAKLKNTLRDVASESAAAEDSAADHTHEALGAETDTEKLLSEMDHLLTASHEAEDPEDPSQKLIEEFESMSQEVKS